MSQDAGGPKDEDDPYEELEVLEVSDDDFASEAPTSPRSDEAQELIVQENLRKISTAVSDLHVEIIAGLLTVGVDPKDISVEAWVSSHVKQLRIRGTPVYETDVSFSGGTCAVTGRWLEGATEVVDVERWIDRAAGAN